MLCVVLCGQRIFITRTYGLSFQTNYLYGKVVIAHESVEFCEATPIDLANEPKESLYRRETDRDLRNPRHVDASRDFILFSPNEQLGGVHCPTFSFFLFYPVQQTTSGIGHRVK